VKTRFQSFAFSNGVTTCTALQLGSARDPLPFSIDAVFVAMVGGWPFFTTFFCSENTEQPSNDTPPLVVGVTNLTPAGSDNPAAGLCSKPPMDDTRYSPCKQPDTKVGVWSKAPTADTRYGPCHVPNLMTTPGSEIDSPTPCARSATPRRCCSALACCCRYSRSTSGGA
jgi:hypothetical protein